MRRVKFIVPSSPGLLGLAMGLAFNACAEDATLPTVLVQSHSSAELNADSVSNPFRVAPSSRSSVQVMTSEDIAAFNPRDVFDLLSHAVGVFPMYQGRKVPVHLQIRGDTNFAYIIDGAYVERDTGSRILSNLPVSVIEQVDVVRDATALTLGPMVNFTSPSGAPNDGFIVIRTKRPTHNEVQLKGVAENLGTLGVEVSGAVASEENYVSGALRSFSTDGPSGEHSARDNTTGIVKGGFVRDNVAFDLMAYHDSGKFEFQRADTGISTAALVDMKWGFDPIETTLLVANGRVSWNAEQTSLLSFYQNELKASFQ